jgi:hypothetical protein
MKKTVFLLSFLVCFSLAVRDVFAFNIRVDTRKVKLKVNGGETHRGIIKVENPTENEIKVKVYLEDFSYIAPYDGAKKFFPPASTESSCASWITFSPHEFTLPAFAKQSVNYVLNVPEDIHGGYYAVLFFETALGEISNQEGANILILGRIGTLFLIETEDSIKRAKISIDSVEDKIIKAKLLNQGNVNLVAKGSFYIINDEGRVFERGKIKDIYLSAGDAAPFLLTLNSDIPFGRYILVVSFDLEEGDVLVKEIEFSLDKWGKIKILEIRD